MNGKSTSAKVYSVLRKEPQPAALGPTNMSGVTLARKVWWLMERFIASAGSGCDSVALDGVQRLASSTKSVQSRITSGKKVEVMRAEALEFHKRRF